MPAAARERERLERHAVRTSDKQHEGHGGIGIDHQSAVGVRHIGDGAADDHHPRTRKDLTVKSDHAEVEGGEVANPNYEDRPQQTYAMQAVHSARA